MSSAGGNLHKKGEHVFNDIAGSLENAFSAALATADADSLVLVNRYGRLNLYDLPRTASELRSFVQDKILQQAREVVSPATGVESDVNSRVYGDAKMNLERILASAVTRTADLIWKKTPRSNSSFHEFEAIVSGVGDTSRLRVDAKSAVIALIDSAYDPQAEADSVSERTSEAARRRKAIAALKEHLPALKEAGVSLIGTYFDELERVLDRRISAATAHT